MPQVQHVLRPLLHLRLVHAQLVRSPVLLRLTQPMPPRARRRLGQLLPLPGHVLSQRVALLPLHELLGGGLPRLGGAVLFKLRVLARPLLLATHPL